MPKIISRKKIANVDNFCRALEISRAEFDLVAFMDDDEKYKDPRKLAFKKNGKQRIVKCPTQQLRRIQSRVNERIFKKLIQWPEFIFGSIPNEESVGDEQEIKKDYVTCASQHCEAKSLFKIDISDFFSNIHQDYVFELFEKLFNYDEELSRYLVRITCYKGTLVQGALTSSYIASLILWNVERSVVKRLGRWNLVYTRLVDDITVSSKVSKFNFDVANYHIRQMLIQKDLPINEDKTKVTYSSSSPLLVHGLRVSFKTPRLPSDEIRKIRAAVQSLEKLYSEPDYNTSFSYRKDYQRCVGRVNKLARVHHEKHKPLMNRLKKIRPKPSIVDLKISYRVLAKLQKDYKLKCGKYWYVKQYWQLIDRINLINQTFHHEALFLRVEAKKIKP
ncbi:reverse transcriptase family protein [Photobacterium sanguinicancri]|uniref:Reverse transcriptase family protein n=1 Tax=Photobacterium sanguinicancri TaxID=875932 RepID=A0AAW7Y451_9GAMM|nr:reverse transcriptase family protein [Photobacterium sanguinicancri]MDO6542795.1 reverse transcriptase family protein [Photobacterium sanguinicancri]